MKRCGKLNPSNVPWGCGTNFPLCCSLSLSSTTECSVSEFGSFVGEQNHMCPQTKKVNTERKMRVSFGVNQ